MLILTRRTGETIHIGNEVTLTVLGVKGNQARLGIAAPKNVPVHREEIFEKLQREQSLLNCEICKGKANANCSKHGKRLQTA